MGGARAPAEIQRDEPCAAKDACSKDLVRVRIHVKGAQGGGSARRWPYEPWRLGEEGRDPRDEEGEGGGTCCVPVVAVAGTEHAG